MFSVKICGSAKISLRYIHVPTLPAELAKRHDEEAEQLALQEEGLVTYTQRALHERGDKTKEHTKTTLAGRQRLNEQTKQFMKQE